MKTKSWIEVTTSSKVDTIAEYPDVDPIRNLINDPPKFARKMAAGVLPNREIKPVGPLVDASSRMQKRASGLLEHGLFDRLEAAGARPATASALSPPHARHAHGAQRAAPLIPFTQGPTKEFKFRFQSPPTDNRTEITGKVQYFCGATGDAANALHQHGK